MSRKEQNMTQKDTHCPWCLFREWVLSLKYRREETPNIDHASINEIKEVLASINHKVDLLGTMTGQLLNEFTDMRERIGNISERLGVEQPIDPQDGPERY